MAEYRKEIEYPCGIKTKTYLKSIWIQGEIDDDIGTCPVHKEKCKR